MARRPILLLALGATASHGAVYEIITSGNCATPIQSKAECEAWAIATNFADKTATVYPSMSAPTGCFKIGSNLYVNLLATPATCSTTFTDSGVVMR